MLNLKFYIPITNNAKKFSKFSQTNLNFVWKKLLCNTECKQKVSEFSLPYDGSALKKCARFTEGVVEIRQPSKYRINYPVWEFV